MNQRDLNLSLKLKFDGKEVDAGISISREHLRQFSTDAKNAGASASSGFTETEKSIQRTATSLRVADADLQKVGISAKQTAAALRGVPAQFTDIFTSTSAGQAPLQVMLQQGGQLKDMFGGVAPAAKALGGYVAGLVNPFTIAAAVAGSLTVAFYQGRKESEAYASAIILSGNAAGTSVGHLQQLAQGIDQSFGITQGAAAATLAQLVATGKVGEQSLGLVAAAALTMEQATGQAVEESVKQFAELGKEPVKASLKLNDQYRYLTAAVFEQVKALEDQGRTEEAARVAQDAFAASMTERANKIKAEIGFIEWAWKSAGATAREAWDAMLNVGREDKDLGAQLKGVQADLAKMDAYTRAIAPARLAELEARKVALEGQIAAEKKLTEATAAANVQDQARIKWLAEGDKYLSKAAQREREIAKVREQATAAGVSQQEAEKRIAFIEEKYAEKRVKNIASTHREYDALVKSLEGSIAANAAVNASTEKLTATEKKYAEFLATSKYASDKKVKALFEQVIAQEKAAQAATDQQKLAEEVAKAELKRAEEMVRSTDATTKDIENIRQHTAELGLSKEQIDLVRASRYDDTIALKEHELAELDARGQCTAYSEALRDNIQALKDRRTALQSQAVRQAEVDVAKEAAKERKRGWEETDRLARDTFTTWATEGSNASKKIGDSLKKALLSAIYEAQLKPIAFQIYNSAAGALGIPGAGGAGGLLSNISGANSVYNASQGSGLYGSFATSEIGQAIGLSAGTTLASTIGTSWAAGAAATSGAALGLGSGVAGIGGLGAAAGGGTAVAGIGGLGAASTAGTTAAAGGLTTLGAAVPWVAGALVIAHALGAFGKGGGPQQGQYGQVGAQGYQSSFTMSGGDTLGNKALNESAYNQAAALYAIAGKKVADLTIQQGYKLDPQGTSQGLAYRNILIGGKMVTGPGDGIMNPQWRGGKDDAAGAANFLGKLGTAELMALVKEINDPKLTAAANALTENFGELEKSLPAYMIAKAAQKAMSQSLMTTEEKTAAASSDLKSKFDALGIAAPTSTEAFRKLIDGLDITTQSGQDTLAALNALGPAWQEIDAATRATTEALAQQMADVDKQFKAFDLSPLAKSLLDIADATTAAIEKATKLSATEAELSRIRELGAKQAQALVTSQAYGAYTNLLNATGNQKGAAQFQADQAKAAYTSALNAVAGNSGVTADVAQRYIDSHGGIATAVAAYWAELDQANVDATDSRRIALTNLATAAANMATAQQQLASATNTATGAVAAASVVDEHAAAVANERRSLQDQVDSLSMSATQLREKERAAIDESNRALFDRVQALTEARQAEQERQGLQDQLDQLTMSAEQLIKKQRDALKESNRALFDQIQAITAKTKADQQAAQDMQVATDKARSNLTTAYQRESQELQATADKFVGFSRSLLAFRDQLLLGNLSTLSPTAKYDEASAQLDKTYALAKAGDTASIEKLQSIGQQFLEISQVKNASSEAYAKDVAKVRDMLETTASLSMSQAGIAQAQLTALRSSVQGLIEVNNSVISVRDAIVALRASMTVPSATTASAASSASAASLSATAAPAQSDAMKMAALILYKSATGGVSSALYDQWVGGVGGPGNVVGWNGDPAALRSLYGFAKGGIASGGQYIAGEHGPELIEGIGATRIYPADQTSLLMERLKNGNSPASADGVQELRLQTAAFERMNLLLKELIAAVESGQTISSEETRGLKQHLAHVMSKATK